MNLPTAREVFLYESTVKKQVTEILLILIGGGALMTLFFENFDLSNIDYSEALFMFSYQGCNWLFLWKGNEYMVRIVDHYYSWLENPGKRLLVGLVVMLVYTMTVSIFNVSFFFGYIKGGDVFGFLSTNFFEFARWPIGITSTIMTFAHSRAFFVSWRQTAINAEKLKQENISTKFESLKNQVNPHFLFNSLNVLTSLVYEDQDKAVSFIRKLSDVYRYVLVHKEQELIPIGEELKFLENYTYLQKIRFDNNLIVNVNKRSNEGWVPPLVIQLLVENAIKHNTVSEAHPLTVDVDISDSSISVKNNIREKLSKDSTGIGLQNIKERYSYLSEQPVEIENDGKTFKVVLPLLNIDQ